MNNMENKAGAFAAYMDWVAVLDRGLLMLQKFAPPGAKPNNESRIKEIEDDGDYLIEFPIGDEPMEKHSQVAPYPKHMLRLLSSSQTTKKEGRE